jgi:hypothetical protein
MAILAGALTAGAVAGVVLASRGSAKVKSLRTPLTGYRTLPTDSESPVYTASESYVSAKF